MEERIYCLEFWTPCVSPFSTAWRLLDRLGIVMPSDPDTISLATPRPLAQAISSRKNAGPTRISPSRY